MTLSTLHINLLLLINLYEADRETIENLLPTLIWLLDAKNVYETPEFTV